MTKTHASDNELMNAAKAAVRTLRNNGQLPVGSRDTLEKMMNSNSLFEFADAMRLGRSRSRAHLMKIASDLTSQIEHLMKKEVR
jgi:hypothetical protein